MPPKAMKTGSSQKLAQAKTALSKKRKTRKRVMVRELTATEKAVKQTMEKATAVAAGQRRSARASAAAPIPPQYFTAPTWGIHTGKDGGSSMTVVLGPYAGESTNYGSAPANNTPSVMRKLLDEFGAYGWIAGHLLNDNLGGHGGAQNLTPLTTAGNKNHLTGCETLIKNTIEKAAGRARNNRGDEYWFGVDYEVKVSDDKHDALGVDDGFPTTIATLLLVTAKVVRQHKQTLVVSDLPVDEDPSDIHFDPFTDKPIQNTMLAVSGTTNT